MVFICNLNLHINISVLHILTEVSKTKLVQNWLNVLSLIPLILCIMLRLIRILWNCSIFHIWNIDVLLLHLTNSLKICKISHNHLSRNSAQQARCLLYICIYLPSISCWNIRGLVLDIWPSKHLVYLVLQILVISIFNSIYWVLLANYNLLHCALNLNRMRISVRIGESLWCHAWSSLDWLAVRIVLWCLIWLML